jgi:AraC-like DNA-binding protein
MRQIPSGVLEERPAAIDYQALKPHRRVERLSEFEHRTTWDVLGHSGTEHTVTLRSGMSLVASNCRWREPLSVSIDMRPSAFTLMVSRGPGMLATTNLSNTQRIGGGTLQVLKVNSPIRSRFDAHRDAHDEVVKLDIDQARLNELLGTSALPTSLACLLESDAGYANRSEPMTPQLFRLLDEILYCDAKSASRQLYLEAKGLELLSLVVDQLEAAEQANLPRLRPADVERLQRARTILIERLDAPPTLAVLARQAGLNEAKLKAGFRSLFGSPVFAYLRAQRMEEARRLLRARRYNVTEVAVRVGYSNPSKFAAAFKKQFGVCPSAVA